MFLKKLFNFSKDYTHYLEKGDRCMVAGRYADARNAYLDALEKLGAGGGSDPTLSETVRQKIALTGNMLGRLNLVEAEHALSAGDRRKAEEHLQIIMELSDDATLRETAERLLAAPAAEPSGAAYVEPVQNCGSCRSGADETVADVHQEPDGSISGEDRLALFFQTLPGDLPGRYAGMGEEFARGCLLNLEGNGSGALRVFEGLSESTENDILAYEKAILYFQTGDAGRCEQFLLKAVGLNPANPLCNIGLVQLYTETGRGPEALKVLERMIASGVAPEQARLMQGDVYLLLGDETNAVESYSQLLAVPQFAREAAERLVPVLERQGRSKEANYLLKKFIKGCC